MSLPSTPVDLNRIRTDFRVAITILFAAVTSLGILPFAVYRLVRGELLVAAVDLFLVACMAGSSIYAWRGGNPERLQRVMAVIYTAGVVVISHLIGQRGVMWMYPVLLANFMLAPRWLAMGVSIVGVAVVVISPAVFDDLPSRMSFLVTAVVTCLFAFILAYRTDAQRAHLENLATHDALTGIHNRRTMDRELAVAIDAFRRHRTPHGLAMIDLDHFKRVNDTFGHEAGDRVLIDFAAMVNRIKRRGDRFFRFGGEEFVLLLPGADAGALGVFCEHLRQSAAAELHCDSQVITVSIGAAVLLPGEDPGSWLARADDATYEAKRLGRDCVVMASDVATRAGVRGTQPEQGDAEPTRRAAPAGARGTDGGGANTVT